MPTELRLVSLEAIDMQDGGDIQTPQGPVSRLDEIRFIVVLDGRPVRKLSWTQSKGVRSFTEADNLTEESLVGDEGPYVFWSFANITVYDADADDISVIVDRDTDEWIQTVSLDHRDEPVSFDGQWAIQTIEIGAQSALTHLDEPAPVW